VTQIITALEEFTTILEKFKPLKLEAYLFAWMESAVLKIWMIINLQTKTKKFSNEVLQRKLD
jgi:hypothetical protein